MIKVNKTALVFKELSNLYGAQFNRVNGNVGGDIFNQWVDVIEPQSSEVLFHTIQGLRYQHAINVDKCKSAAIPTIDFFRGLTGRSC